MNRQIGAIVSAVFVFALARSAFGAEAVAVRAVLETYCLNCHDADSSKGGLNLAPLVDKEIASDSKTWEKVVRRLHGRQMPPAGKERPDDQTYLAVIAQLETALDRVWAERPN